MRDGDGPGYLFHSKQSVNQGYPFSIIIYKIGILPLICELCTAHFHVTQLWYAENTGKGGTYDALQDHIRDLPVRRPPRGYFLDLTKSISIV